MRKKLNLLPLLFLFVILLTGCTEYDPWDSQESKTFLAPPEIPTKEVNSNYIYLTHEATLNNRPVRNYSMCFDKTKLAACWVAYPLHSCYMGSLSRTDAWAFDPQISSTYQAPTRGYSAWNYTRGHQIPSADRTATTELNSQTFYMSNMTPQGYYFNSGAWLSLENRIRSYRCNDTLYVVTGAYWDANTMTYVSRYPVPTHYYKLVLRTRKGNTHKTVFDCTSDELKCIGFWMEHKVVDDANSSELETLNASHCKSVAEIENITGFTFFPEVPVNKTQCVPSDWGY